MKRKFTLKKIVPEGAVYPRGYGFAYYDWKMDTKIAYPVPFNVFARAVRRVYFWYLEWFVTMRRGHSPLDRMLLQARQSGRSESYKKGKADGFEEGRTMLFGALRKELQEETSIIRATLVNELSDKDDDSIDDADIWAQANDDNPPA